MMRRVPAGLDGNPNPVSTPERSAVLDRVVEDLLGRRRDGRPLLVGIDGIDGSGKSTFADEIAGRLIDRNLNVVRSTIDSFHNPRELRRARGPSSPVGFYLDSHNLDELTELLLDPLRRGPSATYRTAAFDEPSDSPINAPERVVRGDELLVFDGIFLQRPELADYWDFTVFLEAQARVDLTRLGYVMGDAPLGGVELVDHVLTWVARIDRYSSGMQYYLDTVDPKSGADVTIDNNDLSRPFIVETAGPPPESSPDG